MNTQITTFEVDSNAVRIVEMNGESWFVLRDVLQAMGSSTRPAIAKNAIEKKLGKGHTLNAPLLDSMGRTQEATFISESGLYALIMSSQNGQANGAQTAILSQISDSKAILRALNEFEIPDDFPEAYVYAIRETETGRIKLGISRDPEARVRQLQTGNSQRLELVAYRKAVRGFADEAALHTINASKHLRGEWFAKGARLDVA